MAISSAALNGTSSSAKYQSVYLEFWQVSQSIAGNTTTFGYKAYMKSTVSGSYGNTGYGHYQFTGATSVTKVINQTWSWNYTTSQLIKEGSFTIAHNADGTLASQTLTITAGGSTALGYATVSVSLPVATIPRATTPIVNSTTIDMGAAIAITVNGASTAFTHNLYYAFPGIGNTFITTVAAGTTSYSWTIPTATLAPKIPSATSGTVTITAETLSGATVVGTKTTTFTATVPASAIPTIGTKTATEAVAGLATQFAAFIQGKSKLSLAMAASGVYGSTISSYSITGNGQTFSASSGTTNLLNTAGTNTITYKATDSRGRSATATLNVTVLAYTAPQISVFKVERVNASGVPDVTGTKVKATYAITVAPLGLNKNTKAYTLKYKTSAASAYTSLSLNADSYTPNTSTIPAVTFSFSDIYNFQLVATDYFGSTTVTGTVNSGFVPTHFRAGGVGVGIGMRATKPALELGLPFYANNHLQPLAYALEVTISTTYAYAFSSSGDRFSSAVRFSVRGTSGNVVVAAMVEILANHSNKILISGTQGDYTPVTVKAISNGSGNFDVFLKHSGESSTSCFIEVIPVGGAVVSFTPLNASAVTMELALTKNGHSTTGGNAIVESGSNTNGRYIRFSDGTQICYRVIENITGLSIANGSVWTSGTYAFPATFTGNPIKHISCFVADSSGTPRNAVPIPHYASNWQWFISNTTGATIAQLLSISLLAIGRWK